MATVTNRYDVSPLDEGLPFGATVSGLTREMLDDESVRKALYDLWIDKGVVLFRDGEDSEAMQLELSSCFGQNEEHLFPSVRAQGNSALTNIKFYPNDGALYDVKGEQRGGWLPWHSDLVYSSAINHGGILRPQIIPPRFGKTGFLCQIAAYERLPQTLRDRIEGLHAVYEIHIDFTELRFANIDGVKFLRMAESGLAIERKRFTYPRVIHPMVYEQELTGRKVLNSRPGLPQASTRTVRTRAMPCCTRSASTAWTPSSPISTIGRWATWCCGTTGACSIAPKARTRKIPG
jgi:taurine dioxygenase